MWNSPPSGRYVVGHSLYLLNHFLSSRFRERFNLGSRVSQRFSLFKLGNLRLASIPSYSCLETRCLCEFSINLSVSPGLLIYGHLVCNSGLVYAAICSSKAYSGPSQNCHFVAGHRTYSGILWATIWRTRDSEHAKFYQASFHWTIGDGWGSRLSKFMLTRFDFHTTYKLKREQEIQVSVTNVACSGSYARTSHCHYIFRLDKLLQFYFQIRCKNTISPTYFWNVKINNVNLVKLSWPEWQ